MKLCVFIHYSQGCVIPYYVTCYLAELSNHFDQVILVTNTRTLQRSVSDISEKVSLIFVENQGYDFGMFYKVIQTLSLEDYQQIACVNDSNVLFKSLSPIFSWSKSLKMDFWGLADSHEKPWFSTHRNNYHIQSFFMVFEKKAILRLQEYMEELDVDELFAIQDIKEVRRRIINVWEIGLSQYMLKHDLVVGSFMNSLKIEKEYRLKKGKNLTQKHFDLLMEVGYPLLKKKAMKPGKLWWPITFTNRTRWDVLIRKYGDSTWDVPRLIAELERK